MSNGGIPATGVPGARTRRYIEGVRQNLRGDSSKLAEELAFDIERDIIERGWPVGELIGSEEDLLKKYDVSRAIYREAVRLLEHHAVGELRRGRVGGLYVSRPDYRAVASAAALYLEYERVEPEQVNDTRIALELQAVERAAQQLTPEARERLLAAVDPPESRTDPRAFIAGNSFHSTICDLSGNGSLRLFVDVLRQLTAVHSPAGDTDRGEGATVALAATIVRAHRRIAEAMVAGDIESAKSYMRRHLASMTRRD